MSSRWGAGRYDVDSHTLCLKLALSDACHYSEVDDSASDLVGFQSTVYCR